MNAATIDRRGIGMHLALVGGVAASVVTVMALAPESFDRHFSILMVCLMAISLTLYLNSVRRYGGGGWLALGTLFNLSYLIVLLMLPVMDLVGYSVRKPFESYIWSPFDVRNRALGTAVLGLVSFHLGSLTALAFSRSAKRAGPQDAFPVRATGLTLLVLCTYIFFIGWLSTSGSMIKGEYAASDAGVAASYFYKLFKVFFSALIIVRVTKICRDGTSLTLWGYLAALGRPTSLMLFVFSALAIWVGDRGPLIYFALLTFGPYFLRLRRLSFCRALVIIIGAAFFLSVLGEARQARFSQASYSERLVAAFEDGALLVGEHRLYSNPIPLASFVELASSVRSLNHAVANVPDSHPHTMGLFQLGYIYSVIPGVSAPIAKLFFAGDTKYGGSSNFVTYLIQGDFPNYGDGTSVAADLYLDFGIPGVAFSLMLFGMFAWRADQVLLGRVAVHPFFWVASLFYFANSLYLARSALLLELSNVVLIFLAIMLAVGVGRAIPSSRHVDFR